MADLKIAVVGDSGMWGQGLLTLSKYWLLATGRIRERLDRTLIFRDRLLRPRSGAKIRAATGDRRAVVLPSGRVVQTVETDRASFVDTYPEVFESEAEMLAFLDPGTAAGEEPARRLFGEIPSTFPTITYQIASISQEDGDSIDLLFLNGGANDFDFETFLNPQKNEATFRQTYEPVFKTIFHDRLRALLLTTRRKCPNALIIVTGYYSALSSTHGLDRLEDFFYFQAHANEIEAWLNDFFVFEDVQDDIYKAVARSNFGHALGLYWMRKTVAELNEDPHTREPGLIFVPSGFTWENGLFSTEPFLHEHYDAAKVDDAARQQRVNSYPRANVVSQLRDLQRAFTFLDESHTSEEYEGAVEEIRQEIRALLPKLKGPRPLIQAMKSLDFDPIRDELRTELARINRVEIASFIHPNEAGARQYADNIVARFDRQRQLTIREDIAKLATTLNGGTRPAIVSVKDSLTRYGLDPGLGLRACAQHMVVDSLAIELATATDSTTKRFHVQLNINPDEKSWLLTYLSNVSQVLRAGTTDLIPLDTSGDLHLSRINRLVLSMVGIPASEDGATWKPRSLRLFINGKEVFQSSLRDSLTPGSSVRLPYPH